MAVETGTYISDFVIANPADTDLANETDDHIRLIKSFLRATFPGTSGDRYDEPVTATSEQIDSWDARLTAMEGLTLSQVSPVAGTLDTTGLGHGPHSVTGIGFQPRMIWVWGSGGFGSGRGGFSFAAWHEDHDKGYPTQYSTSPANNFAASVNLVGFAFAQYLASGSSSNILSIDSVNSDGFDYRRDVYFTDSTVFYVAFP